MRLGKNVSDTVPAFFTFKLIADVCATSPPAVYAVPSKHTGPPFFYLPYQKTAHFLWQALSG